MLRFLWNRGPRAKKGHHKTLKMLHLRSFDPPGLHHTYFRSIPTSLSSIELCLPLPHTPPFTIWVVYSAPPSLILGLFHSSLLAARFPHCSFCTTSAISSATTSTPPLSRTTLCVHPEWLPTFVFGPCDTSPQTHYWYTLHSCTASFSSIEENYHRQAPSGGYKKTIHEWPCQNPSLDQSIKRYIMRCIHWLCMLLPLDCDWHKSI